MSRQIRKDKMTPADIIGLDVDAIKADFPILDQEVNGHRLVYLDNAASSQKPREVINALIEYYRKTHSNVHRGLHTLAERATDAYENTRKHAAHFIGATDPSEVIFTRGATESLNMISYAWGEDNIKEGDEIVVTEMEHHANLVPWYALAKRKQAILKWFPITVCGHLDLSNIDEIINQRTKVVAVSHMSNVLGTINPIADIAAKAHSVGAIMVADGAQAAPHMSVNVHDLGIDFYALSSHKMLGPTGVGVLWGRRGILEKMEPFLYGGEMIREVRFDRVTWADSPHKFEAGTPNIADVVAFDSALSYLEKLGMDRIRQHEIE
ncbi:MAG: aminotransferase class V-fold PLP-dependent enzyme, partial [Candidatus Zixiibacteriota bacterium]